MVKTVGAADTSVPQEFMEAEMFVQISPGHGDTIMALTNRGRIFVRKRDHQGTGSNVPMRWYLAPAPDFSADFQHHRP